MAKGGEVFVLDMGKPVLISDLARNMVKTAGLTIKNEETPFGDIEIKITGMRPGEKLFEELLIGENAKKTIHPRSLEKMDDLKNTSIDYVGKYESFEKKLFGIKQVTKSL